VTVFFKSSAFSDAKLAALDAIAAEHEARREGEPVSWCGEIGTEYRVPAGAASGLVGELRGLRGSDVLVAAEES
jgi:hypothetical protein